MELLQDPEQVLAHDQARFRLAEHAGLVSLQPNVGSWRLLTASFADAP
jgi:hypothetical protein